MTKFQTNEFLNSYNETIVLQGNAYTYRISPESFISFVLTNKKLVIITANGSNARILPVSHISSVRTGIGSGNSFAVQPVSKAAYLPRVAINKNPDGSGGAALEGVEPGPDRRADEIGGVASREVFFERFRVLAAGGERIVEAPPGARGAHRRRGGFAHGLYAFLERRARGATVEAQVPADLDVVNFQ